jgi:hypothetical protein
LLYTPESFEPLTDEPWREEAVLAAIRAIVRDVEGAFDPDTLWPATDAWDSEEANLPLTTLYAGASGVLWALDALRRRGHADVGLDVARAARRTLEAWRAEPDFPTRDEPPASLYLGEGGVLVVAYRLAPSPEVADALHARCVENVEFPSNELMHGAPGTMLAALAMLEWTGEERWAEVWRASAEELWRRRDTDGLWTYALYGRGLGASHGVGTNTNVLLAGGELLPAERHEELRRGTAEALARRAVVADGLANWPMAAEDESLVPRDGNIRLQWCHGGAGVVASTADYLDEELLLAGAELVWRAGPPSMEKGPGICHGTAGNGYALLRTFGRTGEELWLERARRFAVHALGQALRWRERRGVGRYSLWSGDVGAALFAADCLDARTAVPIVDGFTD